MLAASQCEGDVHAIPDATRVGNPAEDSMQIVYLHGARVGVHLPPMVGPQMLLEADISAPLHPHTPILSQWLSQYWIIFARGQFSRALGPRGKFSRGPAAQVQ